MILNPTAILAMVATVLACSHASAQSSINSTGKFAYSANTGWMNLRPSAAHGVVVTETFLSGFAYAANTGWIHFGDGTPENGHTYANTTGGDHGVNHDGTGNLSGLGYSANTGWIHFGWASGSNVARPRIDLLTGAFSGFAYSANTGWIRLGTGLLTTDTLVCIDTDTDGIADSWEWHRFGDLTTAGASTDFDDDTVLDRDEYLADTHPKDVQSNPDGLKLETNEEFTKTAFTFTSSPKRLYRIATSTDMLEWNDSDHGLFIPDAGDTTTRSIEHLDTTERLFFKSTAHKPLQPSD